MLKKWKEYSFLLCLGISIIPVLLLYYTEVVSLDFFKEEPKAGFLQEEITFLEKAEIGEAVEYVKEFGQRLIQVVREKAVDDLSQSQENTAVDEGQILPQESKVLQEKEVKKQQILIENENIKMNEKKKEELEDLPREREGKSRSQEIFTSDSSYFKDALFIGDSRTEGLREYGELGEAVVVADSGMSVYRLWKDSFLVEEKKQTLEEVLTHYQFGKVYFMLGVNELGYDYDQTMKKFRETLNRIEETQPDAYIFLQANLHVTDEKGKQSDIYNNTNINYMNQGLKELAEEKGYIYLDVNPLFDDQNGNLSKEYTVDHAHILGKYYTDWVNWILQHCVK